LQFAEDNRISIQRYAQIQVDKDRQMVKKKELEKIYILTKM